MFDDFCTIERQYLEQRQYGNNHKISITFQENQNNLVQIDKLLQCFQFGDCQKDTNLLSLFEDNYENEQQIEEPIIIDESKTGKTIYTLKLNVTKQYLKKNDLSQLANFTKFCPNLLSLHIILDQNVSITHENIIILWKNIATHLGKLREIKFEMNYVKMESKKILEIVNYISKINNIISLALIFDFCSLSVENWKLVYYQFNKLKKLNTLILEAPHQYQNVKPKEKLIANRQHKTLLRLVNKNISISNTSFGPEEDYDDMGFPLFD